MKNTIVRLCALLLSLNVFAMDEYWDFNELLPKSVWLDGDESFADKLVADDQFAGFDMFTSDDQVMPPAPEADAPVVQPQQHYPNPYETVPNYHQATPYYYQPAPTYYQPQANYYQGYPPVATTNWGYQGHNEITANYTTMINFATTINFHVPCLSTPGYQVDRSEPNSAPGYCMPRESFKDQSQCSPKKRKLDETRDRKPSWKRARYERETGDEAHLFAQDLVINNDDEEYEDLEEGKAQKLRSSKTPIVDAVIMVARAGKYARFTNEKNGSIKVFKFAEFIGDVYKYAAKNSTDKYEYRVKAIKVYFEEIDANGDRNKISHSRQAYRETEVSIKVKPAKLNSFRNIVELFDKRHAKK